MIIFVRTHYGDNNKENVQLTPMMQYNTQLNHNTNQQNLAMIEDFLRPFVPESNHKSNSNISPFLNPMESNEVSTIIDFVLFIRLLLTY